LLGEIAIIRTPIQSINTECFFFGSNAYEPPSFSGPEISRLICECRRLSVWPARRFRSAVLSASRTVPRLRRFALRRAPRGNDGSSHVLLCGRRLAGQDRRLMGR